MELWHFEFLEGGPKTRKSAENRQKMDLLILVFIYFRPGRRKSVQTFLSQNYGTVRVGVKNSVHGRARQGGKLNSPNLVQAIFHINPLVCTLGQEFNLLFLVLEGRMSTEHHTYRSFL